MRLMTIHAAKGLEFPIVLLANTQRRRAQRPRARSATPSSSASPSASGPRKTGHFMTSDFDGLGRAREGAARRRAAAPALRRAHPRPRPPRHPARPAAREAQGPARRPRAPPPRARRRHARPRRRRRPRPRSRDAAARGAGGDRATACRRRARPRSTRPSPSCEAWSAARAAALRTAGEGLRVIIASSVRPIDRVSPLAATSDAGDTAISLDLAPPVDIGTAVHRVMELISLPAGDDLAAIAAAVCAEAGIGPATAEVLELADRCLSVAVGAARAGSRPLRARSPVLGRARRRHTPRRPHGPRLPRRRRARRRRLQDRRRHDRRRRSTPPRSSTPARRPRTRSRPSAQPACRCARWCSSTRARTRSGRWRGATCRRLSLPSRGSDAPGKGSCTRGELGLGWATRLDVPQT